MCCLSLLHLDLFPQHVPPKLRGEGLIVNWHHLLAGMSILCMHRGKLALRPGEQEVCDPRQASFSELHCKAKFPEAYAITYWLHSW